VIGIILKLGRMTAPNPRSCAKRILQNRSRATRRGSSTAHQLSRSRIHHMRGPPSEKPVHQAFWRSTGTVIVTVLTHQRRRTAVSVSPGGPAHWRASPKRPRDRHTTFKHGAGAGHCPTARCCAGRRQQITRPHCRNARRPVSTGRLWWLNLRCLARQLLRESRAGGEGGRLFIGSRPASKALGALRRRTEAAVIERYQGSNREQKL